MKKSIKGLALLFMAIALVFAVAACNNDKGGDKKTGGEKSTETKKKDDKEKQQADLSDFAVSVQAAMSKAYGPFAVLYKNAGAEGEDYSAEDVKTAAGEVPNAVSTFSQDVDGLTVPASLSKDDQQKLKDALNDLKDTYTKMGDAAKDAANVKDGKALANVTDAIDKAKEEPFGAFQSKFNEVAKSLGLGEMDFNNAMK